MFYENMVIDLKEALKTTFSVFGYIVIAGIMCVICYSSIKLLFNYAFTDVKGYDVYGIREDSEEKEYLYTYGYAGGNAGGEDDEWKEYEDKGYTLEKYTEYTKLSTTATVIMSVLSQLLNLIFVGTFIFSILLKRGGKDGNLARVGAKKPDALKGLKVTLMACIPALLSYIFFVFSAMFDYKGFLVELYVIANVVFWPIYDLIFMSATSIESVTVWQLLACLLLHTIIPIIGAVSYYVGYKDYEFLSKILYKKKRG